ncbi:hypothetical protein PHLGIDRAFT_78944 [Phlebiopsis gigantea 11061_1 CR5-6]|uniref:MYND-type domain-containing protein n=1 Tax=Phlebiopsis gigantea (strain 11061_1 CR5-6) TaxID=745531 RepID=A0A0C3S3S3_PHLG1|nr:hypothetical protein PHLGIDRAFT_78944 [Phlebiopsis gigantea 11061_1 CR5-6]
MSTKKYCAGCGFATTVLKNCAKCKAAVYCSPACQTTHWAVHKPVCRALAPGEVWGIEVLSAGDMRRAGVPPDALAARFRHVLLTPGHPALAMAELCPATAAAGLPVAIYSPVIHAGKDDGRGGSNQPAVYLRVEVDSGLAPLRWQLNDPGTCILHRADRRPLTRETAETLWKWIAMLMSDAWGYPEDGGWAPASDLFAPAPWQLFSRQYYREQREKGRKGFTNFYAPL